MIKALLPLLLLLPLCSALPVTAEEDQAAPRRFAVRTSSTALLEAFEESNFKRWVLPNNKNFELIAGPEASGDFEVLVQVLPAEESLKHLLKGLPVNFDEGSIMLGGTRYDDPRLRLALRLPMAEKPTWLVAAFDVDTAAAMVDRVLMVDAGVRFHRTSTGYDYVLLEHPFSERSGYWQERPDRTFGFDPAERDDLAARTAFYAAQKGLQRKHITLRVAPEHAAAPDMLALASDLDRAAARMLPRIPGSLKEPLVIVIESDFARQGRHLAKLGVGVLHEGRLHVVAHPEDAQALEYALARALVRRAGLALPPWLEDGAALWLAEGWLGKPYGAWLPAFAAAEVLPTAEELLAEERRENSSDVLWPPVAAAVVNALEGDTLKDRFRNVPSTEQVRKILVQLTRPTATQEMATQKMATQKVAAQEEVALKVAAQKVTGTFQNGISFAMANGLDVGYHAPGVDPQLAYLKRLGANSVSLMPFAFQRSPAEPRLGFRHDHPSSETDVGMIHAARRAHGQGFSVLWKPHIWVSHDSWPGDIAMTNDADWATWWHSYQRFIMHHAVLAEHTGSELFSIGVELGRTLEREAEWTRLIQAVRSVYSGELTYSGNWWGDYDRAPFWPLLDYVGVDAYFPLAPTADASRATLEEGAHRAVEELRKNAERFGRPVLLTEVGFAAQEGAWIEPHKEGGTLSESHQKLAYEVFLEALGHPEWLAGMYVWKVFSHADVEGGGRPDFRLVGREAEAVVGRYFGSPQGAR